MLESSSICHVVGSTRYNRMGTLNKAATWPSTTGSTLQTTWIHRFKQCRARIGRALSAVVQMVC